MGDVAPGHGARRHPRVIVRQEIVLFRNGGVFVLETSR